ncbi:MAG: TAXI family TRAP transporter solute-binding subunit, partial [Magnetovibrio sp.]|nr:TAXI family TRAP transporter solute-binding subunit [Magnetovibrio sp.]
HRGNAMNILNIYKIDPAVDIQARGLQQSEASRALIDHKIDAFFYTVGNPSAAMEGPADAIKVDLININSQGIKDLVAQKPYYVMTTIPPKTYKGINHLTQTYAVKATVVTSTAISDQTVYDYVKTVFENLEELKGMHSAFKILNAKDMLQGLTAPLHNGALKYYKERGLIPD